MKSSVSLFARTLGQVNACLETAGGEKAVSQRARGMAAGLAVVAATMSAAPAMAQDQFPAHNDAPKSTMSEGQANGMGAIAGGIIGAVLTRNASSATKLLGVFGGAYAGKSLAASAYEGSDAAKADMLTRPYQVHRSTQGGYGFQQSAAITRASYEEAVVRASMPMAGAPTNGMRALDPELHSALYGMLQDVAAKRSLASQEVAQLNRASLMATIQGQMGGASAHASKASMKGDQASAAASQYLAAYKSAGHAIRSAQSAGYDIAPQAVLFNQLSVDLKVNDTDSASWPGVQAKIAELQKQAGMAQTASLSDLDSQAQSQRDIQKTVPRER